MKPKSSSQFWVALTIFSLMGQVAWVVENMYFNVFLYKIFNASSAQISAMVAASAVTATVTTVLMGALSDKIAKRKLLIWLGYVAWGLSIFAFAFLNPENVSLLFPGVSSAVALGANLTILMDCVMTFFGSTANDAAFNAWLTDSAEEKRRGAAEGVNAMMPLVAILVVFGGFMFFDTNEPSSWKWIFSIIGIAVTLIGFLGLFLLEEPKLERQTVPYRKTVLHGFLPKTVREHPALYGALGAFLLFCVSIQIFMPYLILYYEFTLGMKDYVLIMAPAIILASIFTALWGKVYDKKGFRFSATVALILLSAGYVLLYTTRGTLPVFIGSLLMMCGYLAGMTVFGALIRDRIPKGKAGMFQGIRMFSQVLVPGVVGPFLGNLILTGAQTTVGSDGTSSFLPNANIFLGALVVILAVFPVVFAIKNTKKRVTEELVTPFEAQMDPQCPWSEYPRPQMVRDSYLCLNGTWDFSVEVHGETAYQGKILVPFPPESRLSGVCRETKPKEILCYQKTFRLPDGFRKDRVLMHFGAIDQTAEVFLNDIPCESFSLPYLPFSVDLTSALQEGENTLTVRIRDEGGRLYPRGKQSDAPGGMWYTPISGIWQTVWLESVPENAIQSLRITPDLRGADFEIVGGEREKTLILWGNGEGREYVFSGDRFRLSLPDGRLWTPEDPFLYRFTLTSGTDRVESYFALRTVGVTEENGISLLTLNGKPYYFHGVLDQGYFPDGIFLPATPQGYRNDILQMKACGFNMLRKHIKIEPALFYYECDRLGMAVFQDMVNNGSYSFLLDTALPTVGLKRGIRHKLSDREKETFLATSRGIQETLYHHPCVLYYTIFNEGWGQFDADGCYRSLKEADPSRIYDATSGWFSEKESDVESHHVYFKTIDLTPIPGRPMVLSEFGGYSLKLPRHSFNLRENYGYRFFHRTEAWENAMAKLYREEVLPHLKKGLCATVLTQLSDVEDETNGLLTYDRQVLKGQKALFLALKKELDEAFSDAFPPREKF